MHKYTYPNSNMRNVICFFYLLFNIPLLYAQETVYVEDTKCVFTLNNGRITGDYKSYYPNGSLKSSGKIMNSLRQGNWKIYNKTGQVILERNYTSHWKYETIYPSTKDRLVRLLSKIQFNPVRNAGGYYDLEFVRTEDAILRHKLWRNIYPEFNSQIFKNRRLEDIIKESVNNANDTFFYEYRMLNPMRKDSANSVLQNKTVRGYRIYEEFLFDKRSMLSHYRIIGIAPIVYDSVKNDTIEAFWIYFPGLRNNLAKMKVHSPASKQIENMDDLFIFRDFSGAIYKTTNNNPFNTELAYYNKDESKSALLALKEDIEMIEKENDSLIYFNSRR